MPPTNPFATPASDVAVPRQAVPPGEWQRLYYLALLQRVLLIGLFALVGLVILRLVDRGAERFLGGLPWVIVNLLAASSFIILKAELGLWRGIAGAVGCHVALVNVGVVLYAKHRVREAFRQAGVSSGFLGPSLRALRRERPTSLPGIERDALGAVAVRRSLLVIATYLAVALVFFSDALVNGRPTPLTTLQNVTGPAERAGLQEGDEILGIDGEPIRAWEDVPRKIRGGKGPVSIELRRGSEIRRVVVEPSAERAIGISPEMRAVRPPAASALMEALGAPLKVLVAYYSPSARPGSVMGPVGMLRGGGGFRVLALVGLLAALAFPTAAWIALLDRRWLKRRAS